MSLQDGSMPQNSQDKEQFPSAKEMGKNLAELLYNAASSAMQGDSILVSDEERIRRFDICKACKHFAEKSSRCRKCGCYLKHKTQFTASECPIQKW